MPNETVAIKGKTRRVKDHILNQYLGFVDTKIPLSENQQEMYKELTLIFAKNIIPRTTELTGEDGQAVVLQINKAIADKNGIHESPVSDSNVQDEIQSS